MTFRGDLWVDSVSKTSSSPRFAPSEGSDSASAGGISACSEDPEAGGAGILGRCWPVSASGCEVKNPGIKCGCSDALLWDALHAQLNKKA